MTILGTDYVGTLAMTKTGLTCQQWTDPEGLPRDEANPTVFPDGSIDAAENFCRNPGNMTEGPWCYTTDPYVRWEYCNIPWCSGKQD